MDDDWDLHAVVRGCTTTTTTSSSSSSSSTTTTATATEIPPPSSKFQPIDDHFLFFPDLFKPRNDAVFEDLHHLYKPFFPKSEYVLQQQQNQQIPISPLSVLGGVQDLSQQQLQQKQQQRTKHLQPKQSPSTTTTPTHSNHSLRSKRRKNQMKKVCHVPAEGLSSDMWSWRKYGQKPIKGSPYPRGYYRCSTSKGCLARKQVERNRSDPGMFIVTYTAEHNHPMPTHRNSLAGSTRQKPESTQTAKSGETNKPTCSPETEKVDGREEMEDTVEVEEEEDDLLFGVSDTVMGDDFFEGLDELADPATGEIFPDHFPATIQCAWLINNVTTTAAGGG